MQATAVAQPNIALVKYWGKQDRARNLPAVGSLSITLEGLETRTAVRFDDTLAADSARVNGHSDRATLTRVSGCLDRLRELAGVGARASVESETNFPVAAGLASSASGFAALVTAADAALGTGLDRLALARLAGAASGSAARSLYGGFVELHAPAPGEADIRLTPLCDPDDWPLAVVVALADRGAKAVGSSEAMLATAATSPFYDAWVREQPADLAAARGAVAAKDFERLAEIAEHNCLKMHASMLAARPGLIYWHPATVAGIHCVRALRADGVGVFFTIDAGPQLKAVCLPDDRARVAEALGAIDGVRELRETALGAGARVVTPACA